MRISQQLGLEVTQSELDFIDIDTAMVTFVHLRKECDGSLLSRGYEMKIIRQFGIRK